MDTRSLYYKIADPRYGVVAILWGYFQHLLGDNGGYLHALWAARTGHLSRVLNLLIHINRF
jgi:hypothetical protein